MWKILLGDPDNVKPKVGWTQTTPFIELVLKMMEFNYSAAKRVSLVSMAGFRGSIVMINWIGDAFNLAARFLSARRIIPFSTSFLITIYPILGLAEDKVSSQIFEDRTKHLTNILFSIEPRFINISFSDLTPKILNHGLWYERIDANPTDFYRDHADGLGLKIGARLATAHRTMLTNPQAPLISGDSEFFVSVTARLLDHNNDNWPAIWLMPIQHSQYQLDRYCATSDKHQEWIEIDIDEGGITTGMWGMVHHWHGVWPDYKRHSHFSNIASIKIDRTAPQEFGFHFEPKSSRFTWWLNKQQVGTLVAPDAARLVQNQDFYLLMTAASHGKNIPFEMVITQMSARTNPIQGNDNTTHYSNNRPFRNELCR